MENKLQLKDILTIDLKNAMKSKDTVSKNTIQSLRAAILQYEIDNKQELTDDKIIDIISKEKKKRLDALEQFNKSDRQDLIQQTQKELNVISKYLPQPATQEEIEQTVINTIKELNATQKDFGKVMKEVTAKLKNRTDGKTISGIVKQKLNQEEQ